MNDVTDLDCISEQKNLGRVQRFLYKEARLLDQSRFDEWLALFADDGTYWIPATRKQASPLTSPSIIYDNKDLLSMRVRRLCDPQTFSTMGPPHTNRIIGNIELEDEAQGETLTVYSTTFVHEYRENNKRLFSALCTHVLRETGAGFEIVSKRVDMVDCDSIHHAFMSLL